MTPREIETAALIDALDDLKRHAGNRLSTAEAVCFESGWKACLRWLASYEDERGLIATREVLDLEREP